MMKHAGFMLLSMERKKPPVRVKVRFMVRVEAAFYGVRVGGVCGGIPI